MKKSLSILLAILMLITPILSGCSKDEPTPQKSEQSTTEPSKNDGKNEDNPETKKKYSEGLSYSINEDGVTCTVTGLGTCKDSDLRIPDVIDGYSVTVIGIRAFSHCKTIMSVTIGNNVTKIEDFAFEGCSLRSIRLPESVTSIGFRAFSSCYKLESIIVDKNNPIYHSDDNCMIETKAKKLVVGCQNSIIPTDGSVTSIGDFAFENCKKLTSIHIPNCITNIGFFAFDDCSNLESIVLPDNLTSIGYNAFSNCDSLTSIVIPDSITNIDSYTFKSCSNLTSVVIGSNVTNISHSAFYGCYNMESIIVDKNNSVYYNSGNCVIETKTKTLVVSCKNSAIPTDGSVTGIGSWALSNCDIPTSIKIPDCITTIEDRAFYGCVKLTSIEIPDSVTNIGESIFNNCHELESIFVNNNNSVYHSSNNCLINTKTKTLIAGCKNSVIPTDGSVTNISHGAFVNCKNLTSIEIPNTVTSIGECAFAYCEDLTSVVIGNNVTNIGNSAFIDCTKLTSIMFNGTKAQWNTISKASGWWKSNVPATVVVCSDGEVSI